MKYQGKNEQWDQGSGVGGWPFCNILKQAVTTNQVSQEDVGDEKGNEEKDGPFR